MERSVLQGLKVADFTTSLSGPHCTCILADLGAKVVKIEPPTGEVMRRSPPRRNKVSMTFLALNSEKTCISLDLKSESGVAEAKRVCSEADIVVENFRPGVMARLGLGYETLKPINPKVIMCAITGFGQTGPIAQLPAYAPVVHALSGYDRALKAASDSPFAPDPCTVFTADVLAGTYAFGAIAAALYAREKSGIGAFIDLSMFEAMLGLMPYEVQYAQTPDAGPPLVFRPFRVADGYVLISPITRHHYVALAEEAGCPHLLTRGFDALAFHLAVEHWSEALESAACLDRLRELDIPCANYRTVEEALKDPQLKSRDALVLARDGDQEVQRIRAPFQFFA